ncbi:unnamed protein product [Dracunculus medinensis]|uniref:SCP domain-containing protein n=1 Tax=Dracunculus medinensis TaxID=318479 RepID=A0A3P7PE15_DRAME|nr:unnamed protein product [Dracunculus medinensis]
MSVFSFYFSRFRFFIRRENRFEIQKIFFGEYSVDELQYAIGSGGLMASKCPASKITEEMRSYVLKEHNKLRSQLANGEAKAKSNGLMPRSSNMHELEWDCGLEERAQQWAEYCDFEIQRKNSVIIAMAWAITSKLGCGMAKCHNNNGYPFMVHVVCHYGPRGNWDKTIYEEGEPCSKCSDYGRVCNGNGNGLCIADDTSVITPTGTEAPSTKPKESEKPHDTGIQNEKLTDNEINKPSKPDSLETSLLIRQALILLFTGSSCRASKITSAGRENILKKLNDIRRKVAMGQFSTSDGTYPAAKEMYKLRWNCTLEKLAQEHVDKCHYNRSEHFYKHFHGDGIGESLFTKWTVDKNPTSAHLTNEIL